MRIAQTLLLLFALSPVMPGQSTMTPAPAPGPSPAGGVSMTPILADLDRLQAAAAQANIDLGHMRIEKWKADSGSKQQAQANADSVQRNLTSALPGLIAGVRSAPQDVNAEFKLYRNLNALYDVFASLTESAGAFGPRNDYDALVEQLSVIDSVRRNVGDALERLTSSTQSELDQLRTQVRTLQQQAAAVPAAPPKKVVVDDTAPAKKTTHKKKTSAQNASSGSTSSSGDATKPQ